MQFFPIACCFITDYKLPYLKADSEITHMKEVPTGRWCPLLSLRQSTGLEEHKGTNKYVKGTGKAIPLQACTGPEGSRRLRFQDFKTVDTWRW